MYEYTRKVFLWNVLSIRSVLKLDCRFVYEASFFTFHVVMFVLSIYRLLLCYCDMFIKNSQSFSWACEVCSMFVCVIENFFSNQKLIRRGWSELPCHCLVQLWSTDHSRESFLLFFVGKNGEVKVNLWAELRQDL